MFPHVSMKSHQFTYKWIVPPRLLTMMTDPTGMKTRQHLDKCNTEHLHPPFFLHRDGACSPASSHASQFMEGLSMHDMLHSPGASSLVPVLGFPLQPHRCPMSLIFLNLDYPVEYEVKTPKICVLKVSWGILS